MGHTHSSFNGDIMENNLIKTLDQEAEDLSLHVSLCQQRYLQIIDKLDSVDNRLATMENTIQEIKLLVSANETEIYKKYLSWAGFVVVSLIGVIIHYALK